MSIDNLKQQLPDFARDIRINLGRVLDEATSKGLSNTQIFGIALASAYATQNPTVITEIQSASAEVISAEELEAAKSAASVMAMTNVYYRTVNQISDPDYTSRQSGLRMQVLANHGINKTDFELYSLAVSAVNGCHHCVDSHAQKVVAEGVSKDGVQSTIRIAAVLTAAAQAISIPTQ